MTGRAIASVAAVVLLCSGLATIAVPGGTGAGFACPPDPSASTVATAGPHKPVGEWNSGQVGNAAVIAAVGQRLGVPPQGWVIAVGTAMQESSLTNRPDGPDDSVGLFQQRPSQGWGTRAQLMDREYASRRFYGALVKVAGWQRLPLADAAQAVQKSMKGRLYAKREKPARQLVAALAGKSTDCGISVGPQGWVAPVKGPIGDEGGFRTAERPGHDGVDILAPRGRIIHAAAAGAVVTATCNASTGNCDVDGSADVRGCGWYVDIRHAANIITRYCHMQTRPLVTVGQTVTAGQAVGYVGSSGNSSGPHLHFEVHLNGDPGPGGAIDPVPFMAARNAKLGLH